MGLIGTWIRPERKQWQEFKLMDQPETWFQVYDIGDDIYAIYEPYQEQEVISFLICGEDKALLWDTGFFGGNIKTVVDTLWQKELIVVNSHTHFDHVCGNYLFDKVYVHNSEYAFQQLNSDIPKTLIQKEYRVEGVATDSPFELDIDSFFYRPGKYEGIDEGSIFDLGGRSLKLIYTPGHTDDSIMLVDEANRLLFTGDTYYPGVIFGQYVDSLVPYYETLYQIGETYATYTLIPSHNEPRREGKKLLELAEALQLVSENKSEYSELDNGMFELHTVGEFKILTKKGERK